MQKRFLAIAAAIIIAGGAGFWYAADWNQNKASESGSGQPGTVKTDTKADTGYTVGKVMPRFSLPGLDGKQVTVGGGNKVTVINFWATWCPPCRAEMPELDLFAGQHKGELDFYAVNIQEPREKVADFMAQNKYTMPVVLDENGTVAGAFRVNAIPTTVIVDKNGVIKYRKAGSVAKSELERAVKGL